MENPKDLKKRIEEKTKTLEAGETEILFSGKYPFLILYKSIKFIEIELLKDFSFYADFNFDGIIEAICEANEEIRFQYRNKFQCYKRNEALVIDYLKPFENLKEIGNQIEFFVSKYEKIFNKFLFHNERTKIAEIVKEDDEFSLKFFKVSFGKKEISKIFNKKNWNYFKCYFDIENNESEFYFNNIEKMLEIHQEIKKIEILKPLKEEIEKVFSKEKEKVVDDSFDRFLIDEALGHYKKFNSNKILKIYKEANKNNYMLPIKLKSNIPEIERVEIKGKYLEFVCFQSSREDLLFQEPKVRFKEIFSIIRKIVESKAIDNDSCIEIKLDFYKDYYYNFLNLIEKVDKTYAVRSVVFSGKEVSINFYFYEEKEVLKIEKYLKEHNFNVKLCKKNFGWETN